MIDLAARDADGDVVPLVPIVPDNGGPFRSSRFEAFIATHPELRHVRTWVRSPGQNGSRERGFGTLKYERLFLEEVPGRPRPDRTRRGLPGRVQHRPPARGTGLEPARRGPPGPGRPPNPELSRDRNPANRLTRDTTPSGLAGAPAVADHIAEIITSGTHNQIKALVEALVAKVTITGPAGSSRFSVSPNPHNDDRGRNRPTSGNGPERSGSHND